MKFIFYSIIFVATFLSVATADNFFCSPDGDNTDGSSYEHGWVGLDTVNSHSFSPGDTVFFRTGDYYTSDGTPFEPQSGVVYIDSSKTGINSAGTYHYARITSAAPLTGWSQIDGNIYSATLPVAYGGSVDNYDGALFQEFNGPDSGLVPVADSASVDAEGEFWVDSGSTNIVAYCYGGGDPDNKDMWWTHDHNTWIDGKNNVTISGLAIEWGSSSVLGFVDPCSTCVIHNCRMGYAQGYGGQNPTVIGMTADDDYGGHYNIKIVACSISYAVAYIGDEYDAAHGAGSCIYTHHNIWYDSCVFNGEHTRYCLWLKNDRPIISDSTFITHCIFRDFGTNDNDAIYTGTSQRYVWIYKNLFVNGRGTGDMSDAIFLPWTDNFTTMGYMYILNNTFYEVDRIINTNYGGDYSMTDSTLVFDCNLIYSGSGNWQFRVEPAVDWYSINYNLYDVGGSITLYVNDGIVAQATWIETHGFGVNSIWEHDSNVSSDGSRTGIATDSVECETYLWLDSDTCYLIGSWQQIAEDPVTSTYYVSKNGSDANSGTSWNQAWLTLDNVNDTAEFHTGDSVIFGAGIYRGTIYIPRLNSSSADKTYYLDSAWVAGTTNSRVAWIYGSDTLAGWTQIGESNVYTCDYTPTTGMNDQVGIWQGDSILFRQADSADVDAAGESWYSAANEAIIAYVYGGDDPDNYQMEIGQRPCVVYTPELESGSGKLGRSSDNWVLQGLGFKYSNLYSVASYNTGRDELGFDSCLISHCYFGCNAGAAGENASLIYTPRCGLTGEYDPFDSEDLDGADHNRITACSLAWNYTFNPSLPQERPPQGKSFNGGGMNFYSWRFSVIDSCIFWGDLLDDAAIKFKVANDADDGGATYDTIRFNIFNSFSDAQLVIWTGVHHLAIYGNIFQTPVDVHTYDLLGAGIMLQNSAIGSSGAGYHKIYNNTFYNVADLPLYHIDNEKYEFPARENEFKYNLVYQSTGLDVIDIDSTKFWVDVDSNMYYAVSGTNTWETDSASDMTFSGWQGQGMDLHSTDDVDPGFDSVAASNPWLGFARSGASAEMNVSYGGVTWTLFGAVQETAEDPVTSLMKRRRRTQRN